MTIIEAIVLGIVQGLTEFLPVSSSGHLVLLQKVFQINEGAMLFTIMLHFGTLISIFIVFRNDIFEMIKSPLSKLSLMIISATIPTVLIALLLKDLVEDAFSSASTLGFGFLFTGVLLWTVDSIKPGKKELKEMTFINAILIGIAQGLAIFPAVSRSGSTIAGALFQNFDRRYAAKFSFLMSIPAILGSLVFQVKDIVGTELSIEWTPVIIGTLVAAASGYFAIRFMMEVITKKSLKYFSVYVFVLGGLVLLDQYFFGYVF
jgi:undecaprenyl-diphosphatase